MPFFVSAISVKGTISPTITFNLNAPWSKLEYIRLTCFHVRIKFFGMDEIKTYLKDIDATHSISVFMNMMQYKKSLFSNDEHLGEFIDFIQNALKESALRVEANNRGTELIKLDYCIHIYNNVK